MVVVHRDWRGLEARDAGGLSVRSGAGRFDVPSERVEGPFPEWRVVTDPCLDRLEGRGIQCALVHATSDRSLDQAGALQYADVSRECGQRHRERFRELCDHGGTSAEPSEERAAGAVTERMEDGIEPFLAGCARAGSP